MYVLGTDKGEVYVVSREGLSSAVVKLQRPTGLLSRVRSSAAFYLGYYGGGGDNADNNSSSYGRGNSDYHSIRQGVVSLFSLPSSPGQSRDLLLCVGAGRITLWAEWCQADGHAVLWERDLRTLLVEDTQASARYLDKALICKCGFIEEGGREGCIVGCHALDAILLPMSPQGRNSDNSSVSSVTIAVLSACATSSRARGGKEGDFVCGGDVCSLWVHIIEIFFSNSSSSSSSSSGGYHTVRGRYLIEGGLAPIHCGWATTTVGPKIYLPKQHNISSSGSSSSSSIDFYVAWTGKDLQLHLANCTLTHIMSLHPNIISSSNTTSTGNDITDSRVGVCEGVYTPRCSGGTGMSADSVLSICVLDAMLLRDGVSVVLTGEWWEFVYIYIVSLSY